METEQKWSKVGDMYVWCANLELLANDDENKAYQLLEKALALGCRFMDEYYRMHGYLLYKKGKRERGIQEIEKSIELRPSITNLGSLAMVLSYDHDRDSRSVCHRILEQDPKNCPAHIYLGMEAAKADDQDKVLLMVKQAEKFAKTARDYFKIGWFYHEQEKYNEALSAYLKADNLRYEPKVSIYYGIAACYDSLGDYAKAIEYSIRSLDSNFNYDHAKEVLLSATEKRGAELIIDSIIEKHHDTSLAFILYAQEALKQKALSKAHKFLSKAKQLEPSPVEMYQIGHLYANLEYFEEGLKVYLECEKMGYDNKSLLYAAIAGCYSRLEDWGESIRYACKALDRNFNDDYAKDVLMWSLEKEGKGSTFDSIVKKYRDTCLAFILLAEKAIRKKNLSKAYEMIVKAEHLDPSPAEMRNIGSLYHNLGYYEKALDKYLEAKRLGYDEEGVLYAAIADCYISLSDANQAKKYIELAIQCDSNDDYVKGIWHDYQKKFGNGKNLKS
jgi:tetratricopeptide (TPR) repeat protein